MPSAPPFGIASRAFTARFSKASSSSLGSTLTAQLLLGTATSIAMSPRSERLSISLSSGRRWLRSITAGVCICRRENASSCRVRLSPRAVALAIMSSSRTCFSSVSSRRSRCTLPLTIINRLLKSCATPPVNCPIASRRWACRSAPSAASRRSASSCSRRVRCSASPRIENSSRVAGRPKIRWLVRVASHSARIAASSMPATA